ncbi:hypothetical protein C0J52_09044 [Blattella germanica]|nr:hypothetical protein C0J52_09044 [Blattella germanica]
MGAWLNPYTFQLAVDWARILGGKYLELYPLGIKAFDLKDYKKAVRAATDGSITKAGKFPCKTTPFVLGHEISGIVTKVGACVTNVAPGDKVAINPNNTCNICEYCLKGIPNFCENEGTKTAMGYFEDGGWAEYCIIPSNLALRLPETVSLKQAVLSEPLSCITHALDLIQPIPIHTRILISGAGIAGTLMATLFRYQGYPNVTISEGNDCRLEYAKTNFCRT